MNKSFARQTGGMHEQRRKALIINQQNSFAGIIGFVLVDALDVAAPLVVFMGAALGVVGWATHMH